MTIKRYGLLVPCLALAGSAIQAAEDNPVFKSVKYGIFTHHAWGGSAYALTKNPDLSVPKSIDEVADSFDIKRFVKDLQAINPDYISFTAWHAQMNPIFPCAAMDKWRGKGHAAKRDVIGELIRELKPTRIKLFLYIHPSDGHDMTKEDQALLGWNESLDQGEGWKPGMYTRWNNFMNEVFDEMCARYGKDVYGYWVDGGWQRVDKARLQQTVWKYNPKAEFVLGMDRRGAGRVHQQRQRLGQPPLLPQRHGMARRRGRVADEHRPGDLRGARVRSVSRPGLHRRRRLRFQGSVQLRLLVSCKDSYPGITRLAFEVKGP
jgi:hypothetical protein